MDGRERLYHQLSDLTICGTDLRAYRYWPEFKDVIYLLREAREEAWRLTWRQPYHQHVPHWPEHRLQVHAGLAEQQNWLPKGQSYDVPLLDDLRTYMKFQKEVKGW